MTTPAPAAFTPRQPLPTTLAFVAGFVDACTFLAYAGFFVAQATGSFVVAGSELVNDNPGFLMKILAIPVFIVAGMLATGLVRSWKDRPRAAFVVALVVEAVLLCGLVGLGLLEHSSEAGLPALFALAAMGVQSATGRLLVSAFGSTNVMTTNTTQFAVDLADTILNRKLVPRLRQTGLIMLGFLCGVTVGAAAYKLLGLGCVLFAIAILVAIAITVGRSLAWSRYLA